MTFDEFEKKVVERLVSEYNYEEDEAKGLVEDEAESVKQMYNSMDKSKTEYQISSTAYALNLMW
jgi:hypothetical protein